MYINICINDLLTHINKKINLANRFIKEVVNKNFCIINKLKYRDALDFRNRLLNVKNKILKNKPIKKIDLDYIYKYKLSKLNII